MTRVPHQSGSDNLVSKGYAVSSPERQKECINYDIHHSPLPGDGIYSEYQTRKGERDGEKYLSGSGHPLLDVGKHH